MRAVSTCDLTITAEERVRGKGEEEKLAQKTEPVKAATVVKSLKRPKITRR